MGESTQGSTGPAAPTPSGDSAPRATETVKTYTEEEVVQKLRGQGAEIERLRATEKKYEEMVRATEEAARKTAEEQGQFQKLYTDEKARALALEARAAEMEATLKAYDGKRAEAIRDRVAAIKVESVRAQVQELLKDRSVDDQERILSVFLSSQESAPPPRQGGAPASTAPAAKPTNDSHLFQDRSYRLDQLQQAWRRAKEG